MSVEVPALPCEFNSAGVSMHNLRDNQRATVLGVLKEYGVPLCDRSISAVSGLPVNMVTARRNELVESGLVTCAFKAKSPFSKLRVKHWGVTK